MGAFASLLNMFGGGSGSNAGGNLGTSFGLPSSFGASLGGLGQDIAKIGNVSSGVIPSGSNVPTNSPMPMPNIRTGTPQAPIQASPTQIQSAVNNAGNTTIPTQASPQSTTMVNGVPVGSLNGGDVNSVYGVDTGTALTNLYDSENQNSADSTAQAIINANAPNVAQGAASLNTGLAASGISPSSSVSAIENANYQAQVQQQNLAEEAQVSLTEQQMQQQLLESLLPSQQQRQTDSSGWSIFGDIMSGIGDVASLGL